MINIIDISEIININRDKLVKWRSISLKRLVKLTNLERQKKKEETRYQYQKQNKGYHYRPNRHQNDKRIVQ